MTTVVFVHGTGVRQPAFDVLYQALSGEIAKRYALPVVPCYWGGPHGARLMQSGASIPVPNQTRGDDENDESGLWSVLASDPLAELKAMSAGKTFAFDDEVGEALTQQAQACTMPSQGFSSDVQRFFSPARDAVMSSGAFIQAMARAEEPLGPLQNAVARAFLARALVDRDDWYAEQSASPPWTLSLAERQAIVDALVEQLGGGERGLGSWIAGIAGGAASTLGTSFIRRQRMTLSDGASPAVGDILLYQARGDGIRNCIRDAIAGIDDSVVIIAHSLGGIAAVEMLVANHLPRVSLLVTVGSQSPLFYELDVLSTLRYGSPLPDHFPAWVNLYDPRDFLSYVGAGVFGSTRIVDVALDNGVSFPESHSAYWSNPMLWSALDTYLS
ncbi:MAG: hypothetical protein JWM95_15 [Gemmatimonadetes bacterium]|nr:hypothetical protein [Gemmatimonadota bacterium]